MDNITAVIVARKGSLRIPDKMHQKIGNETLILRKVKQCISIPNIKEVIIGTDDDSIKEKVEKLGARFCRMPNEYCKGNNPTGMIKNILTFFKSDYVLWAHPTNPFIDTKEYNKAIETLKCFIKNHTHDSLFSVTELQGHFWQKDTIPLNYNPLCIKHRIASDLPNIYAQNGGIFIRPYKAMAKDGLFIGGAPYMYTMDELIGWDIDYPWQLHFAQFYEKTKEIFKCPQS